jgi:hypothetical protein
MSRVQAVLHLSFYKKPPASNTASARPQEHTQQADIWTRGRREEPCREGRMSGTHQRPVGRRRTRRPLGRVSRGGTADPVHAAAFGSMQVAELGAQRESVAGKRPGEPPPGMSPAHPLATPAPIHPTPAEKERKERCSRPGDSCIARDRASLIAAALGAADAAMGGRTRVAADHWCIAVRDQTPADPSAGETRHGVGAASPHPLRGPRSGIGRGAGRSGTRPSPHRTPRPEVRRSRSTGMAGGVAWRILRNVPRSGHGFHVTYW